MSPTDPATFSLCPNDQDKAIQKGNTSDMSPTDPATFSLCPNDQDKATFKGTLTCYVLMT